MKKPRKLKTLYKVLLKYVEKNTDDLTQGICISICLIEEHGLISSDEMCVLIEHFNSQKPSPFRHVDFYNHPLFRKGNNGWWWKACVVFLGGEVEQRLLFIKHLISTL